ncbi:MAG TPA: flagellar hook-associated protein FlgK [Opitutaceae bacterium]|nr:flagellar hook-associated protein FlgK [Opitutaceae bacterium]
MSGLYATLNSSVLAIAAQSRALEVTGKNLANVNNPNYSRQRVIFGDRGTILTPQGAESMGVEALGVQQMRDQLLDLQVAREISTTSAYTAEQSAYERAQAGLGQSVSTSNTSSTTGVTDNGLGAGIDDFFNAFQSLAASPTDIGERQTLLQSASILTDRFHAADQNLSQVQSDLNSQVTTDVGTVNTLLSTIADLNSQIGRFEVNAPGSAVDLRDERQAKIEELSAKMPVSVIDNGGGQVQIVSQDSGGANVVLVNNGLVQGSVAFNGTQITGGTGNVALSLSGGEIQGALTARDGAVQTLRDNLDALANQLVTSVNKAYNPTGTTGDFFTAAGTTAGTIAVDPAVTPANLKASDGGPAGDNTVALAVAGLANTSFSTGSGDAIDGTFAGFYSTTVSTIGQALSSANSRVSDQTNIQKLVTSQRDSVSGVSLDEEMANLMQYQRAFQASSRVFNVVDTLLDTVVNKMGA